ncbi:hypothetical protein C922_05847, partial [Plasmodium inui San Antonio 1]
MFDGKQGPEDQEQDSLTGDCYLFRKLENLEEEKLDRSEMQQRNIIRDGIHAYKIDNFPQNIHRLRELAVNLEDALFKLCQSIQKYSGDCRSEMSWDVDSAYKAALSPDSGLCDIYESRGPGNIVKEEKLHLKESARIGDKREKNDPIQGGDSRREDIVAAADNVLTVNRNVKTNRQGRTKVGTLTHLRNGKDIDIKQNHESLRKLHSLEKDEVLIGKGILPGVACTVRQSEVNTRKMSGESNSLKSNYGLSKKKLSRRHSCLSSVESDTRGRWSKRSHSLSIIDAIFEDKFHEEDTSVSSIETITIQEISAKVNTTRQIHVGDRKETVARDDSLSTSSCDTTETVDMQKRLRAATGTYTPKGKFEQEAYDYTYDRTADSCCEEGLSREEFYIKRSNEMYRRMQKVKQSYASKKVLSEVEIDSIDDIISRNDSSKKEHASEQVHVKIPNDVPEKFLHMKNRETLLGEDLFKEEYTSYQPILQVKDDFSEESDKLHHAKFEVAGSSMETNGKLGRDELFGKDISGNSIDLLNKEELMREEHLINTIYVTCSKSLYRRMQYINECGLLDSYRLESEREDDNGVYITENNRLFKKINNISANGFTPDEDLSAIVDEYAENLYLTCQNSLFKKIHHQGEGDLENIKELLKRKEKEEAKESVKDEILPQERKRTIYIYLREKGKDKDPDKNKNDW